MKAVSYQEILLDDGSKIVLQEEPEPPGTGPDYNYSNNIYRVARENSVLWQIDAGEGMDGRAPFTSLRIDNGGRVIAFRWDGTEYAVDVETGAATFVDFPK